MYRKQFFNELGFCRLVDGTIYCDNQGVKLLSEMTEFHAWSKNIDIRHHFIRDAIQAREINVVHVPPKDMLADTLTKPLPTPTHSELTHNLGLSNKGN